ncbi:zinc-binding alcohol dehydrogenase [Egibacter rhizosphaerae]|uniref:Zinc-binding alcohol dehydrogenase n=1 Tax=Egibacter rhizosphaerae TaxID=1670831 RepID=A0A411YF23_9ACTN|nr:zinc-binding dehydrogenase [Egibacter rhizosphaerae]QBI19853.1 zinc-binding alcohol dehydrogenase [Egibacter rhizosphaerae]
MMRAACLEEDGRITCRLVPAPRPRSGELLVRTELAAVCGSDLHAVQGGIGAASPPYHPGYPGHEGVGTVVAGEASGLAPGRSVLTVPEAPTASGFAEYQALPAGSVVPLPVGIPPARLVLAQHLGTVLAALDRFWSPDGVDHAAVVGAGSAGLLFVQELRRRDVRTIVVSDPDPARRERARALGAEAAIGADAGALGESVLSVTDGRGADLVVEAAGHDAARAEAVAALADHGTLGLFGLPERTGSAPFPFETLFRRRASAHATYGAQSEPGLRSFRAAVDLIERGTVNVDGWLTHTYPIERIGDAIEHAASRRDDALKIGITFEGP